MSKLLLLLLTLLTSSFAFSQVNLDRFAQVSAGIYRGARVVKVEQMNQLANLGIKTIVNIDDDPAMAQKEQSWAKLQNIKEFYIPLSGWKRPADSDINQVLKLISDPRNHPVYVHCQYGKDRTGLVIGLYRVLYEGWKSEDAYSEMVKMGFTVKLVNLKTYFEEKTKTKSR